MGQLKNVGRKPGLFVGTMLVGALLSSVTIPMLIGHWVAVKQDGSPLLVIFLFMVSLIVWIILGFLLQEAVDRRRAMMEFGKAMTIASYRLLRSDARTVTNQELRDLRHLLMGALLDQVENGTYPFDTFAQEASDEALKDVLERRFKRGELDPGNERHRLLIQRYL